MMQLMSRSALSILAATALACAPAAAPVVTTTPSPAPAMGSTASADTIPASVRWFRASAERRALSLQTYRLATTALERRAAGLPAGSWAVILDADETVIDNSPYQQELARRRATFDAATWNAWVMRAAAAALPGAPEFTRRAHELGGRVVIVTNREQAQCDATARQPPARRHRGGRGALQDGSVEQLQGRAVRGRRRGNAALTAAAAARRDVGGRQHPGLPAAAAGHPVGE
jgi:5'-nucleotidase (lipoprotein e(P4) family)